VLFSAAAIVSCADDGDDDDDEETKPVPWVAKGGFILLIVAVLQMFYALAVVVEEYFVPALNTMCVVYSIPDDVAGATFMAAGASAPELFASFIALFITHSTLGVGTILGSELFNHLIITAGSIFYSKSGTIQTEPRFVGREAFFYALALGTLIWVLSQNSDDNDCYKLLENDQKDTVDKDNGGFICVIWYKSLVLIFGYVLYAVVCGYYQKLIPMFCPITNALTSEEEWKAKAGDGEDLRNSQSIYAQPADNFKDKDDLEKARIRASQASGNPNANPIAQKKSLTFDVESGSSAAGTESSNAPRGSIFQRGRGATTAAVNDVVSSATTNLIQNMAPAYVVEGATADLYDVELDPNGNSFGCHLWKQSKFYSKIPYNSKAWQLRWCQVDKDGFRSYRARNVTKGMRSFNIYESTEVSVVDPERFILKVAIPSGDLYFQAPSEKILMGVQSALSKYQGIYSNMTKDKQKQLRRASLQPGGGAVAEDAPVATPTEEIDDDNELEDHESLMDWPETNVGVFFHICLLPLKASLYYTIPDVRHPGNEGKFFRAMGMSVFFLAVFSFIMTDCMELLGPVFGISDFIMGVVFAAAGTSFPNVFASMVVARQGLGNAAISNALGGNVFNIFMGLGLPWFTYSFLGSEYVNHQEFVYMGMTSGGIIFPTLLLLALLVIFILVLICTGWKLFTSHAYIALICYVGFLVWVFKTSMLKPDMG
jgi:K+-dependent Na+/Ca+ exchanger-like protein